MGPNKPAPWGSPVRQKSGPLSQRKACPPGGASDPAEQPAGAPPPENPFPRGLKSGLPPACARGPPSRWTMFARFFSRSPMNRTLPRQVAPVFSFSLLRKSGQASAVPPPNHGITENFPMFPTPCPGPADSRHLRGMSISTPAPFPREKTTIDN